MALTPTNPNDSDSWKELLYNTGYANQGADAYRPDLHPEQYDTRVATVPGAGVAIWWYQQGGTDAKARWPNRGYLHNLPGSQSSRWLGAGRPTELRVWYTGGWWNASAGRGDIATAQARVSDPANAYLLTATTVAEALAEWQRGVTDWQGGATPPPQEYYDPPGVTGTPTPGSGIVIQGGGGTPAGQAGGLGSLISTLLPILLITSLTQKDKQVKPDQNQDAGTYTRGYSDGRNNRARRTGMGDNYNQGFDDGRDDYFSAAAQPPARPTLPAQAH